MQSVTYEPCDEDGASLVDQVRVQQIAKWQVLDTPLQHRVASIFRLSHWPTRAKSGINYKDIRTKLIVIERSMMSMLATRGKLPEMPTEWVDFCIDWCEKKREHDEMISVKGLVSFIENTQRKEQWIARWQLEHKNQPVESKFEMNTGTASKEELEHAVAMVDSNTDM